MTIGVIVCIESLQTVLLTLHGGSSPRDRPHTLVLRSLEAAAAVLFLIPRTMRWGAAGLLVIFALASGLHAMGGHPNLDLLIFPAAVLFLRNHGVRGYWWSPSAV